MTQITTEFKCYMATLLCIVVVFTLFGIMGVTNNGALWIPITLFSGLFIMFMIISMIAFENGKFRYFKK